MTALLLMRGLTIADFDRFTYGMLINFAMEYDRIQRRLAGEEVPDEEEQYQKLKAAQPLIQERLEKGEISPEKYEEYMRPIWEWEAD